MLIAIEAMTMDDCDAAMDLWRTSLGEALSEADSRTGLRLYLARNPDLSLVAREGGELVGAVLCGHDGRRGLIHHLAVRDDRRRRGIARSLVEACLAGLRREGILKCHAFVFHENDEAAGFWTTAGWEHRRDLVVFSGKVEEREELQA